MAEEVLSYRDLFDDSDRSVMEGVEATIQKTEATYLSFSNVLTKEAGRIRRAQKALAAELQNLDKVLAGVNIITRAGQESIVQLATQVEVARRRYTDLKTAGEGVARQQKDTNAAVLALKGSLAAQAKEFERLQKAGDAKGLQQVSINIRETKRNLDDMQRALRGSTSSFTAAEGSYRALQVETNRLNEELLNLGGTFSKTGQRTATQTQREAELKAQIATNTTRLKEYDAELNRHWRNVGNYAGSIVEAVTQLRAQRRALLDQEAALKNAERATRNDTAAQMEFRASLTQTQAALRVNATQLNQLGAGGPTLVGGAVEAAKNNLRGFVLTTAAATLGFQALARGTRAVIETNNEYSDQLTDVRKTTGLTAEAAEALGEHLRGLSTRTSLAGLLDIAKVGGQLGRTGAEIEGFTDSIDVLAQALSDDFSGGAEQIATEVGKIQTVFRGQFTGDIAENLLAIGSAVNELAADGAATAPQMTDVALRVGAIAANAKLGLAPVLAYAAVLEELGFTAEVSGTTLSRIIGALTIKPDKFFAIAQIADSSLTLKEFTHLINTDVEAAFTLFLRGLNRGGGSTTKFAQLINDLGFKGTNAASVLTSLAKNTDLVRARQVAATEQLRTGNSVMAEAELKNNNAAASWAKLGNSISNFFTSGTGASISSGIAGFFQTYFDGFGDKFRKEIVDPAEKAEAQIRALGAKAVGAQEASEQVKLLADRFAELNAVTNRTGKQNDELSNLTLRLREALGSGVVEVDKESKALKVNEDALLSAVAARQLSATEAARGIAAKLEALEQERFRLEAVAEAENNAAQAQRRRLLEAGVSRGTLDDSGRITKEVKAQKSAGTFEAQGFNIANAEGVRPEQLDKIVAYDTAARNAARAMRASTQMSGQLQAALDALAGLGYDTAAKRAELLASATDKSAAADEAAVLSAKEREKKEKELAEALSRRAASEYELQRARLERREGSLGRTATNEANPEADRTKAANDAADVRKKIAKLEADEQTRLAQESAKKQFTTREELNNKLILISETYKEKLLQVDRELTEEQKKLHNEALAAIQAVESARLDGEQNRLQAVINNTSKSYFERQAAQNQFYTNEKAQAQLAYDAEVRAANGNAEKIKLAKQRLADGLAAIRAEEKFFDAEKANQEANNVFQETAAGLEALRNRRRPKAARSLSPGGADKYVDNTPIPAGAEPFAGVDLSITKNYEQAKFEIENEYRKKRLENLAEDATKTNEFTQEKLDYELWYRSEQERLAQEAISRTEERLNQIGEFAGAAVNLYTSSLDAQLAGLEKQKSNELKVVGDNVKEKSKIEARYEAEQSKIRRRKAIAERTLAIFQIAASTAISVAKSIAGAWETFGLPWSAINAGIGALQIAAVLAQPLPQYAKGTPSAPRTGPALVGEAGPELLREPSGREHYVKRPTVVKLIKGTRVFTAAQTRQELSRRGAEVVRRDAERQEAATEAAAAPAAYQRGRADVGGLTTEAAATGLAEAFAAGIAPAVDALNAAASRPAPSMSVNFDERGFESYLQSAGNRARLLDTRYRRELK